MYDSLYLLPILKKWSALVQIRNTGLGIVASVDLWVWGVTY